MLRMIVLFGLVFILVFAAAGLVLFRSGNLPFFSMQSKKVCSSRLGFCSNVPLGWEVEDTAPKADLKIQASNFRCSTLDEESSDNANEYSNGDSQAFTVVKLAAAGDIAKDDTLSCMQNNCPDLSNFTVQQKTIDNKSFTFVESKDEQVSKIYYKTGGGYYAFYFDQSNFPSCGKKVNPEKVLNKFLEDFSASTT